MNKKVYSYKINFPEKLFEPYSRGEFKKLTVLTMPEDKVSQELHAWLKQFQIKASPNDCKFFCSMPNQGYFPHVDGHKFSNNTKLNIIFNSFSSEMIWYHLLPGRKGKMREGDHGKVALSFDLDDCIEVHRTMVDTTTIINGGQIHTLTNGPNNGINRQCYQISLLDEHTMKPVQWEDAVERFSSIINLNSNGIDDRTPHFIKEAFSPKETRPQEKKAS